MLTTWNGWQRLWLVVTMIWMFPVAAVTYEHWPLATRIPHGEVYARLKPEEASRLSEYYDLTPAELGTVRPACGLPQFEHSVAHLPDGTTFVGTKPFEVLEARRAGCSDNDIAQHLSRTRNFDLQRAARDGATEREVIDRLSKDTVVQGPLVEIPSGHTVPSNSCRASHRKR